MKKYLLSLLIAFALPFSIHPSSRGKLRELKNTLERVQSEAAASKAAEIQANQQVQYLTAQIAELSQSRDTIAKELKAMEELLAASRVEGSALQQLLLNHGQAFEDNVAKLVAVTNKLEMTEKNLDEMMALPSDDIVSEAVVN